MAQPYCFCAFSFRLLVVVLGVWCMLGERFCSLFRFGRLVALMFGRDGNGFILEVDHGEG